MSKEGLECSWSDHVVKHFFFTRTHIKRYIGLEVRFLWYRACLASTRHKVQTHTAKEKEKE
jgi:hypothetical protein